MLSKINRLTKNKNFKFIYKKGKILNCEYFTIHYVDTYFKFVKFGFSISTKVGKSVVRSKVKRILSEAVRKLLTNISHKNYVITAKPQIVGVPLDEVTEKLKILLKKNNLYKEEDNV